MAPKRSEGSLNSQARQKFKSQLNMCYKELNLLILQ